MQDTIFAIGSLVEHPANGRGIIIDSEEHRLRTGGELIVTTLWCVRWDEPTGWVERRGAYPETYQIWWTDDEDLSLVSEVK